MSKVLIFYTLMVLVLINQVSALKCWTCHSSTEDHGEFCGAVFDKSKIPYGLEVLKTCNESKPDRAEYRNFRPVCRKDVKKNEKGEYSYARSCHLAHENEPLNQCSFKELGANGVNDKRVFCMDCTTDACNAGTSTLPFVVGVLGPILIAKLLTL